MAKLDQIVYTKDPTLCGMECVKNRLASVKGDNRLLPVVGESLPSSSDQNDDISK